MMSSWNPGKKLVMATRDRTARTLTRKTKGTATVSGRSGSGARDQKSSLRAENNILAQLRKSADHLG